VSSSSCFLPKISQPQAVRWAGIRGIRRPATSARTYVALSARVRPARTAILYYTSLIITALAVVFSARRTAKGHHHSDVAASKARTAPSLSLVMRTRLCVYARRSRCFHFRALLLHVLQLVALFASPVVVGAKAIGVAGQSVHSCGWMEVITKDGPDCNMDYWAIRTGLPGPILRAVLSECQSSSLFFIGPGGNPENTRPTCPPSA
jgi:hypothetical protein